MCWVMLAFSYRCAAIICFFLLAQSQPKIVWDRDSESRTKQKRKDIAVLCDLQRKRRIWKEQHVGLEGKAGWCQVIK